eukprot:GHVN01089740.1.p1 GENE.GHVN01089740.1~~GHVN01089740.1.p1  ORF type:complete len:393 (+),score=47.49 GHVN01089740.1:227-1405(+)
MSTTIPVWCAVINSVVHQRAEQAKKGSNPPLVFFPPWKTSSEMDHITANMDRYCRMCLDVIPEDSLQQIAEGIGKRRLLPVWSKGERIIFPTALPDTCSLSEVDLATYFPVVCMCASSMESSTMMGSGETAVQQATLKWSWGSFHYVQGAADDEESWSMGLTAHVFWSNAEMLLSTTSDDHLKQLISGLIQERVSALEKSALALSPTLTKLFDTVWLRGSANTSMTAFIAENTPKSGVACCSDPCCVVVIVTDKKELPKIEGQLKDALVNPRVNCIAVSRAKQKSNVDEVIQQLEKICELVQHQEKAKVVLYPWHGREEEQSILFVALCLLLVVRNVNSNPPPGLTKTDLRRYIAGIKGLWETDAEVPRHLQNKLTLHFNNLRTSHLCLACE